MPWSITSDGITSSLQGTEPDDLPISSQVEDESQHEQTDESDISIKLLSLSERFDDFRANKEAKLEEWLEGTSKHDDYCDADEVERGKKLLENDEKINTGNSGFEGEVLLHAVQP